jgi:mRNA interferase RelE/StbE
MKNNYKISITKKAEKFIKKQDTNTQKRIIKAILELPKGDIRN